MKQLTTRTIAVIAGTAISLGVAGSYILIINSLKRELTVFTCAKDPNSYPDVHTIIKSGPEYIIVNPGETWTRNSFLVSKDLAETPLNWRLKGLKTEHARWSGFQIRSNEVTKNPIIEKVTFDTASRRLSIKHGKNGSGYKPEDISITCKEGGNYYAVASRANNVPIGYLKGRSSASHFMMPTLRDKAFNTSLVNEIKTKDNSEYGQYQLLSARVLSQMDTEERSKMERLREGLIKNNTRSATVWEFAGSYRYWWEFANEKQEADNNAGDWCRDSQYSTRDEFEKKGYKQVSSRPDKRSTYGWAKKLYPDGRFAGYVNYKAECDGTTYELRLTGSVDEIGQNSYSD